MSAVTEAVVREYFESLGYFVTQPCKHVTSGRQKLVEEELDLLVVNPRVREHQLPRSFVWASADLASVARAIIGIRGWHTDRFYARTFEQSPELLRFAETEALKVAARKLGTRSIAKVLCLPRLPASGELKDKTIAVLRGKGISGVISFRTMLAELIRHVDTKRNYEKSDVLQVIRLLKNYELLREDQMELFAGRRRRKA